MSRLVFLSLMLLFLSSSCKKNFKVVNACTDLVNSEIRLSLGFLGPCGWAAEGGPEKNMKVTITIDGVTFDEQGQIVIPGGKWFANFQGLLSSDDSIPLYQKIHYGIVIR